MEDSSCPTHRLVLADFSWPSTPPTFLNVTRPAPWDLAKIRADPEAFETAVSSQLLGIQGGSALAPSCWKGRAGWDLWNLAMERAALAVGARPPLAGTPRRGDLPRYTKEHNPEPRRVLGIDGGPDCQAVTSEGSLAQNALRKFLLRTAAWARRGGPTGQGDERLANILAAGNPGVPDGTWAEFEAAPSAVLPRAVASARAALESRSRAVRDQRRRDWVSRLRESASAQWAAVAPTREPPVHVLHIDGQWISDPDAMDAAVQAVWLPIYRLQDHGKPPPLTWNAFRRKYGHSIAKAPGNWNPLSAADLRRALQATNPRSSMGLGGWRPAGPCFAMSCLGP